MNSTSPYACRSVWGKSSNVCNFEMHQEWDGQLSDRVSTDTPNGRIWVVGVQVTGYHTSLLASL